MTDYSSLKENLDARGAELAHKVDRIKIDVSQLHSADWSEQAQERENDEVLSQLGNDAEAELRRVYSALDRMKNDKYGLCLSCNTTIPDGRLHIKPETEHCMECAN